MNDGSPDRLSADARELFRAARAEALPASSERSRSFTAVKGLSGSSPPGPDAPQPSPLAAGPRASGVRLRRIGGKMRMLLAAAALFVTAGSLAAVLRLRRERAAPDVSSAADNATKAHASKWGPMPPPRALPEAVKPEPTAPAPVQGAEVAPLDERRARAGSPPVGNPRSEPKGDIHGEKNQKKGDEMNDELVLLGDARRALAAHQGAAALRLLDEDRQKFPSSTFREERAYTRIRALCELGRASEASADAQRFLRQWPRSMYVAGVRRSCAFAPAAAPAETPAETPADDSVTGSRTPRH